jgi:hypothetical protein
VDAGILKEGSNGVVEYCGNEPLEFGLKYGSRFAFPLRQKHCPSLQCSNDIRALSNEKAAALSTEVAALLQWGLSLIQDIDNPDVSVDSDLLTRLDLLRCLQTPCYAGDSIFSCHDDRVGNRHR